MGHQSFVQQPVWTEDFEREFKTKAFSCTGLAKTDELDLDTRLCDASVDWGVSQNLESLQVVDRLLVRRLKLSRKGCKLFGPKLVVLWWTHGC